MNKIYRIAIDGPAGAGKSTMAKLLAKELNIDYIDTGAMYRALGLKLIRNGIDYHDAKALDEVMKATEIDYYDGRIWLDGEDVSSFIRTPEVSAMASESSAVPEVREWLGDTQIELAKKRSLIMDGRDIGTHIIPDAEYKFYLDASSRIRAYRRVLDLKEKGIECNVDEIERDIKERDYRDSHRASYPLKAAEDAIVIDTSDLTIAQVVEKMRGYIKNE